MIKTSVFTKNPALEPLSVLTGKWNVKMSHMALPNPLTWQASFQWLDNAFIIGRWEGKNEIPRNIFIIGRNENKPSTEYSMFSYDSRGVSRIYDMSFKKGVWKFWREDSDFFQAFKGKINENGNAITGKGENSFDGGKNWELDYTIIYTRIM